MQLEILIVMKGISDVIALVITPLARTSWGIQYRSSVQSGSKRGGRMPVAVPYQRRVKPEDYPTAVLGPRRKPPTLIPTDSGQVMLRG